MSLKEWAEKKPDDVLDLGWDIGGSIALGDDLDAYGTSEGVKKEWDTRGRGRHEETDSLANHGWGYGRGRTKGLYFGWHGKVGGKGLAGTEGNGLYLSPTTSLAGEFGKPERFYFNPPNKLLDVNEEPLYLLQEDDELMKPSKAGDSEWTRLNKEAVLKAGVTEKNWRNDSQDKIASALTDLMKSKGYDAVHVTSGGEKWLVVLDNNLLRNDVKGAAELPKIEGFDNDVTDEIRDYLIKFPRKLLHFTERVAATPKLSAMHGRYVPETKTVEINPRNFSNKMKFGTHNTADIDEHVLAHELCHGLYENLSEDEQQQWMDLSGWKKGWQRGQARPYVEVRPGWEPMVSSWTHAKDARFARRYQEKNPNEDFADSAAYIVTGNGLDIPEAKRKFIEALL